MKNRKVEDTGEYKNIPKEIIKYLTFQVDKEVYGFDINFIVDINRIQEITLVPQQDSYVKGVINLRGQIIPVIEIRARFGKKLRDYDDRTCIIVMNFEEYTVGVIVDTVLEVVSVEKEQITSQKSFDKKSRFVQGITKSNDHMVTLMDIEKLLFE
ncbi:chemotaxis protein CheW [Fusibacter ferrireducens]|uniref:Purine-binding chemotaxis protein CheW n=1 Tax=Fusibacter ferrireducens TaxID=2785058 RepID=A0ABR9ZTK0_9FIRM|nr:chemotaxis protein CheW [Fusibacter ferrireducens]MBF4693793.1 purine-binding chemotaxis protein CheW [Fusibacter ferrireducens]